RPGADVLLPDPHPPDPRPGARGRPGALRPGDPRRAATPGGLRLQPARGLRHLAGRRAGALPRLPLVHGRQAAAPRRVAELPLSSEYEALPPSPVARRELRLVGKYCVLYNVVRG